MTALERRWVESEWEHVEQEDGIDSTHWFERYVGDDLDTGYVWLDVHISITQGFRSSICFEDGPALFGPLADSIAEAKSDAEAMYRQWVYDEYGVVLP